MNNREIADLYCHWWKRTNTRPLIGIFAPVATPYGGLDVDVPPEKIVERKLRNAEALAVIPNDKMNAACVDFSTAFPPALAGAGFEYNDHTSWAIPVASRIEDVKVASFNPHHPLFETYLRRFEPLLANWSWETYVPCTPAYLGPMDILAGLLGPEALAFSLADNPEAVLDHARAAADLMRALVDFEQNLLRQAGMTAGNVGFGSWLPGRGYIFSEDFSALVGERHFREFFLDVDASVVAGIDSTFMHVHSAALASLPGILDVPNLGAIELSNDPNGPSLDALIAAGRRVQAAGKPLQMSNWKHPLTEAEIKHLVSSLDPRGLCITLQADSLEHAHRLYALGRGE